DLGPPVLESVLDVEGARRSPIHRHGVPPVSVEVAHDGHIARATKVERDVGPAGGVRVLQVDETVRLPVQTDRRRSITIPVPAESDVPGTPVDEREGRSSPFDAFPDLEGAVGVMEGDRVADVVL